MRIRSRVPPDFKLRAEESNQDRFVEEQAARGKMSDETLRLLTSSTAKYPKDYNELRHFVKKFSNITDLLFGVDSILVLAVKDVFKHVGDNERNYTQDFIDKWYFGALVIDKVHIRCQMYIRSCTKGEPNQVEVMALNFGEMLDKIYMNEHVAIIPSWVERSKKRGE